MRLFTRQSDPLEQNAMALVPLAEVAALQSYDQRSDLGAPANTDQHWWRFIVTVATVFVAATRLRNLNVGQKREGRLMAIVAREFENWHPRAREAFEDCKAFFDRSYDGMASAGADSRFVSSDPVGGWIAWNILDHAANTAEERGLARQIGVIVTHVAYDAWSRPA